MTQTYHIGNMDCANCAKEVEAGVARLDGVQAVRVDFASGKMILDGQVPFPTLQGRVEALGKSISHEPPQIKGKRSFWQYLVERGETRLALLGGRLRYSWPC